MIKLRTLGESVIEIGAVRLAPDADVLFAALVYLATERGRQHGRDSLAELLWPTVPHDRARHCLRQTVYRLRQIGVDLWTSPSHVELVAAQVVPTFAAELGRAQLDTERADGVLRLGGFLPGYAPAFSERFDEWLDRQRAHVHSQVRRALLASLEDRRACGEWAEVESLARECLAFDPLNEEATLALAESAALSGGKAEAIAILDEYIEELGPHAGDIRVSASVLRRRISERFPLRRYQAPADRCFVGRAPEMAIVSTALQRARNAEGSATLLWGPPGIGKTRLASELRKVATLQGVRIVRVGCEESDAARPMGVWVDAVPQLLNLPGALGCAPESLSYLRRLTEHEASDPASSAEVIGADVLTASIRRAIVDLVDAVCGEHPLLLLVEDVHWIDASSWNVLHELIEWGATKRIQLLFTSRTPHALATPPSRLVPALRILELPPLSTAAGEALVRAAAEEDSSRELTPAVLDWCLGVGEGNPFFLRELAGYWVRTGKTHEVPPSLQVLIDARINSLRPASLFVLQACAVLGRNATLERLGELLGLKAYEMLASMQELSSKRLISPAHSPIELLHDLTSARTLQLIQRPALMLLHRSAARLLETEVSVMATPGLLWDCAQHWRAADENHNALRVLLSGAHTFLEIGATEHAIDASERGVSMSESTEDRLRAYDVMVRALRSAGRWARVIQTVRVAAELKREKADPARLEAADALRMLEASNPALDTDVRVLLAHARSYAQNPEWAIRDRVQAAVWMMIFADNCCDRASAMVALKVVRQLPREESSSLLRQKAYLIYDTTFGSLRNATKIARRFEHDGQRLADQLQLTGVLRNAALVYRQAGHFDHAISNLTRAYAIAHKHELGYASIVAADYLCGTYFEFGDLKQVKYWNSVVAELLPTIESVQVRLSMCEMAARVSCQEKRFNEAEKQFDTTLPEILALPALRSRAVMLATYAQIESVRGSRADREGIAEEMLLLHKHVRSFGSHDRFMSVLRHLLIGVGRQREARQYSADYTSIHRRELSRHPWYLQNVLK